MDELRVRPLGVVRSGRSAPVDDDWDAVASRIVLDPAELEATATRGLEGFSHVEVVFVFDQVAPGSVCRASRHPRGRQDWPEVGILAQRAKDRPNRIGVTICRLEAVDGLTLTVSGLDALDGTPVLDVKPVMEEFGPRGTRRQPAWASELMAGYW